MEKVLGESVLFTVKTDDRNILINIDDMIPLFMSMIKELKLEIINKTIHRFDNDGFNAIYYFHHSSLTIHAIPRQNVITFGFFMSNMLIDAQPANLSYLYKERIVPLLKNVIVLYFKKDVEIGYFKETSYLYIDVY